MLEIGESSVRLEPAPRAYMASSLRFWNEMSDVRLIEPLTVASASRSSPLNVKVPPGGPEVIPSTPINASFVTPPLLVSMIVLPLSDKLWNLKAAVGQWVGSAKKLAMPQAVSKAAVEQEAQRKKATSAVGSR